MNKEPKKHTGLGCLGAVVWGTPIAILLILLVLWGVRINNKAIERDENVKKQWAQVENAYQRRMDLIPNIVNTVKGYAEHEQSTFVAVTEARSKVSSIQLDPSSLSEENIGKFQAAQEELSGTLSRLLVVVEQYPELKANQNFMDLQQELKNTENLIVVARNEYNNTVKIYNAYIRKFPRNVFAKILGFKIHGYFKASEGAEQAPEVQF